MLYCISCCTVSRVYLVLFDIHGECYVIRVNMPINMSLCMLICILVVELSKNSNIIGLKDAVGNIAERYGHIRSACGSRFLLYR